MYEYLVAFRQGLLTCGLWTLKRYMEGLSGIPEQGAKKKFFSSISLLLDYFPYFGKKIKLG
jgi:hypothetical protein